jgi:hypothetical protein
MEPWGEADPDDMAVIMRTLFEINARLVDVEGHVSVIRRRIEERYGREEEDPDA